MSLRYLGYEMENSSLLTVKVWGDFALFTRPEFSAERVSYQILTPSAARGILEAIFWKPEMSWQVREIHVLKPIRSFSILRNEINNHQSERAVAGWQKTGAGGAITPIAIAPSGIPCVCAMLPMSSKPTSSLRLTKITWSNIGISSAVASLEASATTSPTLALANSAPIFSDPDGTEDEERLNNFPYPQPVDFGLMLFDMEITEAANGSMVYLKHDANGARVVKGNAQPRFFFHAQLQQGILTVPTKLYRGR